MSTVIVTIVESIPYEKFVNTIWFMISFGDKHDCVLPNPSYPEQRRCALDVSRNGLAAD